MRQLIISLGDHITKYKIGPLIRTLGTVLDIVGFKISSTAYLENYVRSLRNIPTETHIPDLGSAKFIAPNTSIIGDVKFGKNSSLWYGSVARGDIQKIEIGDNTIIQDLVTIKRNDGKTDPIVIGKNVFIGPGCKIGGCTLHDHSFISMGSTIEDDCVVESYGFLAAGAVLAKGSKVPSGQVWAGSPAHFLREVTNEERDAIYEHFNETSQLAEVHHEEAEKSFETVFLDDWEKDRKFRRNHIETLLDKLEELDISSHGHDAPETEFIHGNQRWNYNERQQTEKISERNWKPFNEDGAVFPDEWKVYGEDMDRYERAKKVFDAPPPAYEAPNAPSIPRDQTPWTRRY
ncbi:unnamed protein product [Blepharisma stoltei]|uniref:Trimeric LpxA-like protein n=1 Tax=Blepharisma stoltei TaxID=1481888 RepID=A0AAU9IG30_9CILI|nr:unnamed protein product [Blepharisma stoltei]